MATEIVTLEAASIPGSGDQREDDGAYKPRNLGEAGGAGTQTSKEVPVLVPQAFRGRAQEVERRV